MEGLGFVASMFQPSENDHLAEDVLVVGVPGGEEWSGSLTTEDRVKEIHDYKG